MKNKTQIVRETAYGCYVWELPSGEILGDDGNYMLVFGTDNDEAAMKAITQAARHYGYPEGRVVFWPDVRPVSNNQYDDQVARMESGLVPDPWDIASIKEEWEMLENERRRN